MYFIFHQYTGTLEYQKSSMNLKHKSHSVTLSINYRVTSGVVFHGYDREIQILVLLKLAAL